MKIKESALHGLKVIDASRVLAGPLAGQILGDHGADVIKVESISGDDTRRYGPPFVDGTAPYFLGLNRNKKNVSIDLSTGSGLDTLFNLLETADVFIENYKASTWSKWGVTDFSTLTKMFPQLIHCRVSGFGDDGELGGLPGYDAAIQALSGLMSVNGDPTQRAARIGIPIVDIATGMNASTGVLLALLERERSGLGQMVEITLFDTALSILHPHSVNVLNGGAAERTGNGHPNIVPYDLYTTKTVPIFLAVGNDRQFQKMCELVARKDLVEDSRYQTNKDRVVNRSALTDALNETFSIFDGITLSKKLIEAGVPCNPVLTVDEALQLQHTRDREMVVSIDEYSGIGLPIKLKRTPGSVRSRPSRIGENNELIRSVDQKI